MPPNMRNARPIDRVPDTEPLQTFDKLLTTITEIEALAHAGA